ncbi:MAG: glycosyltransferase [Armatimonadota bacterium]|nr:glycosyltransferase [Armatimonadota bacterium]MDR5697813.1 glycosyltransferase [Armatimonadota bacterium]
MTGTAILIVYYSCVAVIWALLVYYLVLTVAGYHYSRHARDYFPKLLRVHRDLPTVSILIPARNEERVIADTVAAISEMDYPRERVEIIVIDDGSTDATGEILEGMKREHDRLTVVSIPATAGGRGKSVALNHGLAAATGDVIAVYDADNRPDRYALRYLVSALLDSSKLGAAVGKVRTLNRSRTFMTRSANIEFIAYQWINQAGRYWLAGLTVLPGTNFVIWRHLLDRVGGWDPRALTEDLELTIRVYEAGWRIGFVPTAVSWEQEPEELGVWIRQRMRWMRGNNYVIRKSIFKLLKPWDSPVKLEILQSVATYYLFLVAVLLSDVLFVGGAVGWLGFSMWGPFGLLWALAYTMFVLEFAITLVIEGEDRLPNLLLVALMYFTYTQLWLYVALRSMVPTLRRRQRTVRPGGEPVWEKTKRY